MYFSQFVLLAMSAPCIIAAFDPKHDSCQPAADAYHGSSTPGWHQCTETAQAGSSVLFDCGGGDQVAYNYDRDTIRTLPADDDPSESLTIHASCTAARTGREVRADLRVPKGYGGVSRHVYPGLGGKCDASLANGKISIFTYTLTNAQLVTCGQHIVKPIG